MTAPGLTAAAFGADPLVMVADRRRARLKILPWALALVGIALLVYVPGARESVEAVPRP